ncbi:hypothetical protein BDV97DRAFT_357220 [Delphinella strobiligena]|nr:hypothetical protein BDV97DRAFT_357220 [Delphinella strobiligena]
MASHIEDDEVTRAPQPISASGNDAQRGPNGQLGAQYQTEITRVREVFRYLELWEGQIHPTIISKVQDDSEGNDNDQVLQTANDWTPVGCEDTALAAFAQLGALRLKAQRCIVSLVSKDQEIILAESTRTLSLQSDLIHTKDDALWLGTTSFPRAEGMGSIGLKQWKKTRDVREAPPEDDFYYTDGVSPHWHIISDVRQHKHLHSRLFIRCAKKLRFYASVPIRTPSGTVLGSYAVLDDSPRFGVSARDLEFMEDIADTVMGHLEAKRATVQRQRGDRLVKGLALFNGGKTSLREWWLANHSRQQRGEGQRRRRRSTSEDELRNERADEEFGQTYRAEHLDAQGRLVPPSTSSSSPNARDQDKHRDKDKDDEHKTESTYLTPSTSGGINTAARPVDNKSDTSVSADSVRAPSSVAMDTIASAQVPLRKAEAFDLPKEVAGIFARASNLMREALSAEGVLFVDTDFPRSNKQRRGRYKGSRPDHVDNDDEVGSATTTGEEDAVDSGPDRDMSSNASTAGSTASYKNATGPCDLLGFSTRIRSSVRGFQPSQRHSAMSKPLLNRLLRRYPHGKIFNFYNGRSLSSSSAGEGSGNGSALGVESADQKPLPKAKIKSKEAHDAMALAELVREPRSVAFLPLWDDRRDRWRAAVLVWNVAPNRYLDLEEDVTYLAAFGNSLMSELARLEVIAADQAKATFISSVSHELRSPLHGVLAGVEFLQESRLDPYQQEMATTISMAGHTLLDTINNILDFTKINSFTDAQRSERKNKDLDRHISFKSADAGEVGVTSDVDLADLTENVVNTLVTANQFRATIMKKTDRSARKHSAESGLSCSSSGSDSEDDDEPILVVLDIATNHSWRIHTSPGSWTRIITNLVGNAFKYTKTGTITVSLRAGKTTKDGKTAIRVMVEDTGQGISEDFQKHHLWTPFMQENTHSVGTGLGLSIVKQVVEDIGGRISVESEVGRGTKISVSIGGRLLTSTTTLTPDIPTNLKLGFVTSASRSEQARRDRNVRAVVSKTCTDWVKCTCVEHKGPPETSHVDVLFMVDTDFDEWSRAKRLTKDVTVNGETKSSPPVIVLSSYSEPEVRRRAAREREHIFISQPFGPRKLARALKVALQQSGHEGGKLERNNDHIREIENGMQSVNPSPTSSRPALARITSSTPPSPSTASTPHRSTDTSPPVFNPSSPPPQNSRQWSPNTIINKILLVEDNTVNMKLLIAIMRKLSRSFDTAENGLEAVQLYASGRESYVLVLMDMSMPIMDGFEATEKIRALEETNGWKRCMIVALTGVASAEARQRAFNAGVDTFLTKPASIQRLKAIVGELQEGADDE